MKTDANTVQAGETGPEAGESAAAAVDPFAVDLFAGGRAGAPGTAGAAAAAGSAAVAELFQPGEARARVAASWHASLPRISREEARLSSLLAAVPAPLSAEARAAVARVVARFTHTDAGRVTFDAVDTREENLSALAARAEAPRVCVRAAVEPWDARVVLVMDAAFASVLIDRMLGGEGTAPAEAPRALSTAERAVLEFLCAQLLVALNEAAGEPLFRLEGVTDEAGALAAGGGRGLVTAVRARVGSTAGLVRLVYGPEALAALDELRGPLLRARARAGTLGDDGGEDGDRGESRLARYVKFCEGTDLRVVVGETEVDPADLAELEVGDVVIVESVFGEWGRGRVGGALRARVGGGDNVLIEGGASEPGRAPDEEAGDEAEGVRLVVEKISVTGAPAAEAGERLSMEEESELAEDAGGEAGLLDNLLLSVRVEMAARRISLEELTRLRAGQILDLGCRATDPVELVADGRRVATGELVDIEGRLGVRVTRLTG